MTSEKKQELIQSLISLVIERADKSKGNFGRGYYLLNIQHPVILELYNRYKQAHGIPYDCPMGDGDRLDFELSLFNQSMLREIASWCDWKQEELDKQTGA